jgi:thiol:disulfide interchange protein
MQRFLSAFALAAVMLSGIAATTPKANTVSAADTGIQFVELPWSKALQKAKKEKKLIFFDAYTSWCGPCKMLQKTVFTRSDVGTYFNATFMHNFV